MLADAQGVPFTTAFIAVMGNPVTDLHEDMAAEQKALATYYQLVNLTDDVDIKNVLKFLGEREIVHYQRFGEALMDVYEFEESQNLF
ncbi:manganese catalase family protein [[Clostridium] dakarense]|uniref:manganese catalase family protein n=1 Tax=Faecalimicrobium dakarense TaxID=1301100 RepID=UPI0004B6D490|nr:manganese catalase family protein [[Clostridium] dakarense]